MLFAFRYEIFDRKTGIPTPPNRYQIAANLQEIGQFFVLREAEFFLETIKDNCAM